MKKILGIALATVIFWLGGISVNAAGLEDTFNAKYYADKYADLYEAFEHDSKALFNHFKTYGLKEKRNMSPVLDVVIYRGTYADLEETFGDDWDAYVDHYFTYGIKEGRYNGTDFDPEYYLNSYSDLKAAFGDDLVAAAKHYIEYGYNESRTQIQKPAPVPSVPTTTTVVDGDVTSIYDADGKLIKEIYQDGSYLNYSYNSAGKLAKVERSTGEWITFDYDAKGNPIKETFSDGYWIKYEYDAKGNSTKQTFSDGTWEEYEYDVNGKLTQSTESNGKVTDYDAEERRIRVTYPDGRLTTYEYDANGMPYKEYHYGTAGKIESVMELSYDANGAWQGQTETSYYDYETNKISRIVVWDNTGEIISDVSYHEDGTVIE